MKVDGETITAPRFLVTFLFPIPAAVHAVIAKAHVTAAGGGSLEVTHSGIELGLNFQEDVTEVLEDLNEKGFSFGHIDNANGTHTITFLYEPTETSQEDGEQDVQQQDT